MHLPIRVFVYGTLKTGEPNHHVMAETAGTHSFVGTGRTTHLFPLVVASKYNIPFLLLDKGKGNRIHGEVYSVDEQKLEILDELEAYPKLYTREQEEIELEDGSKVHAWIYMLPEWRESIFEESTELLDNYSSKGDHGREYMDRYKRAIEMLDDGFNLFAWVKGVEMQDAALMQCSLQKAKNDVKAPA